MQHHRENFISLIVACNSNNEGRSESNATYLFPCKLQ